MQIQLWILVGFYTSEPYPYTLGRCMDFVGHNSLITHFLKAYTLKQHYVRGSSSCPLRFTPLSYIMWVDAALQCVDSFIAVIHLVLSNKRLPEDLLKCARNESDQDCKPDGHSVDDRDCAYDTLYIRTK